MGGTRSLFWVPTYDRHWAVGMRGMAYRHDMECTENSRGTLQTAVESQGAVRRCADQDCQSGSWIRPRLQHSSDIAMVSERQVCIAGVVSSRSFVHNHTVPGRATTTATTTAVGTPSIPLVSSANPPFTARRAGLPQVDMRASYTTPQTPTTATTLAQQMLRSRNHLGSQSAADFMFCLSRPLSRLGSNLSSTPKIPTNPTNLTNPTNPTYIPYKPALTACPHCLSAYLLSNF